MFARMPATLATAALAAAILTGCQQAQPHAARRAPELQITAARGIDPGAKLADFRGKWLLIDFWSHT